MNRLLNSRRVVADTRRRDLLVALAAGVAMLGFVLYAVFYFSREVSSSAMTEGVILRKTFMPRPETQITFGKGGLDRQQLAGEYAFRVGVPQENGREYTVSVDPATYQARKEGDHLRFQKPPPAAP